MGRGWEGGSKRTGGEDEIVGSVLSVFGQVIENETRKGMGKWDGVRKTGEWMRTYDLVSTLFADFGKGVMVLC